MNWTTAGDLRAQVHRLWERGELLRAMIRGDADLSLRLALKGPSSAELADRFEAVRGWIAELAAVPRIRIEWRAVNHRVLGAQRVPQAVWVDGLDNAFAFIGKRGEAGRFAALLSSIRSRQPALSAWMEKRPLRALELAEDWEKLLAVTDWLVRHPMPGIYMRQVDIPGVYTKFIEAYRGVLSEWLDLVLPEGAIRRDRSGVAQFTARYGFRERPARIRFRVLEGSLRVLPGIVGHDIALDAGSFAALDLPVQHVFITENETNFLAFPAVAGAIVVFGAGYGWDALAQAEWLRHCPLHYWGDIDTHGFAILDQLRARFGHVESFLMDRATLMAHESLWGEEEDQVGHDLLRLTAAERALFDELRDNRIRRNLRLEQERIGFGMISSALAKITGQPSGNSLNGRGST